MAFERGKRKRSGGVVAMSKKKQTQRAPIKIKFPSRKAALSAIPSPPDVLPTKPSVNKRSRRLADQPPTLMAETTTTATTVVDRDDAPSRSPIIDPPKLRAAAATAPPPQSPPEVDDEPSVGMFLLTRSVVMWCVSCSPKGSSATWRRRHNHRVRRTPGTAAPLSCAAAAVVDVDRGLFVSLVCERQFTDLFSSFSLQLPFSGRGNGGDMPFPP
uniref:Uncharacterized protein n=1 Tax=Plectus sambesii TaxID=2011161 RepID=A0A914W6Q9_9BILA